MARPRRYYKTESGKFYYLVKGKKKYIKLPVGMSQKQLTKININFLTNGAKRIKKKRKVKKFVYGKKFLSDMKKVDNPYGLPLHQFNSNKLGVSEAQKPVNPDKKLLEKLTADEKKDNSKDILDLLKKIEMKDEYKLSPKHILGEKDKEKSKTGGDPMYDYWAKKIQTFYDKNNILPEYSDLTGQFTSQPIKEGYEIDRDTFYDFRDFYEGELDTIDNFESYLNKNLSDLDEGEESIKHKRQHIDPHNIIRIMGQLDSLGVEPNITNINNYIDEYYNVGYDKDFRPYSHVTKNSNKFKGMLAEYETNKNKIQNELKTVKESEFIQNYIRKTQGSGLDDGLYNDEIAKIAKHVIKENYIPVISQDQIPMLPKYLKKNKKIFGAVINTNPSTSPGDGSDGLRKGHWVSVIVDGRDDFPSIEYFDPLVQDAPSATLLKTLRKIGKGMNPEEMFKFKFNKIQRQSNLSNSCGIHSLKFIEDRFHGTGWSEATGYDHWKKNHPDDSIDGEEQIETKKNIYSKYL